MFEPRIAFDNTMFKPQEITNPVLAEMVMSETAWTAFAYGIASEGFFPIYGRDESELVGVDRLRADAISLSLGVFTIDVQHARCNRLICRCKVH